VDAAKPLEDVLQRISKYSPKMRNNGGGHYNHELFWKVMAPNGGGNPSGKLATAINDSFNSFDSFKTQFGDAGKNRFGSGWAWLIVDADKKLRIGSTPNQDNPLMDVAEIKGFPILGLDVWEHAYYLRYQNKRPDYIANWWKVVNWKYVQERYDSFV
jgi:superoxide dismutase, Fe-Mn family